MIQLGVTGLRAGDPSTQINLNCFFLPKSEVSGKLLQPDTVHGQDRGNPSSFAMGSAPFWRGGEVLWDGGGACLVELGLSAHW